MLKISLRNSRKYISKFREIVQTQENFHYFISPVLSSVSNKIQNWFSTFLLSQRSTYSLLRLGSSRNAFFPAIGAANVVPRAFPLNRSHRTYGPPYNTAAKTLQYDANNLATKLFFSCYSAF